MYHKIISILQKFPGHQKELPYTPYFQLLAFIIFIPPPHPLFFFWIFWGQTADIRPHPFQLYTLLCAFLQTKPVLYRTAPPTKADQHPHKHHTEVRHCPTVPTARLLPSSTELSSTMHMVWLALSHIRAFSLFCLSCQSSTVLTVWVFHSQAWPSAQVSPMFSFTQIQAVLPGREDRGVLWAPSGFISGDTGWWPALPGGDAQVSAWLPHLRLSVSLWLLTHPWQAGAHIDGADVLSW